VCVFVLGLGVGGAVESRIKNVERVNVHVLIVALHPIAACSERRAVKPVVN